MRPEAVPLVEGAGLRSVIVGVLCVGVGVLVCIVARTVLSVRKGVSRARVTILGVLNLDLFLLVSRFLCKVIVLATDRRENVVQLLVLVVAWWVVVAHSKGAAFGTLADCLAATNFGRVLPYLFALEMTNSKWLMTLA